MRPSRILAAAFLLLLPRRRPATADLRVPPAPDRRINDYARALTPAQRDRLEQQLVERERGSAHPGRRRHLPIARWGEPRGLLDPACPGLAYGRKDLDNGVIFLVFLDDRKMRIEVGYGLEPT